FGARKPTKAQCSTLRFSAPTETERNGKTRTASAARISWFSASSLPEHSNGSELNPKPDSQGAEALRIALRNHNRCSCPLAGKPPEGFLSRVMQTDTCVTK